MTKFVVTIITLTLLIGCSPSSLQQTGRKVDILILSPQGVAPSIDTTGFNDLARNVTQAFSKKIVTNLKNKNLSYINIIDQNPKYNAGEKLAIYSVKHQSKSAIILTLETEAIDSDNRLPLRCQYIEQEFTLKNNLISGVRPTSSVSKSYLLRSSLSGDNPATITSLANDFAFFLTEKKLLK